MNDKIIRNVTLLSELLGDVENTIIGIRSTLDILIDEIAKEDTRRLSEEPVPEELSSLALDSIDNAISILEYLKKKNEMNSQNRKGSEKNQEEDEA